MFPSGAGDVFRSGGGGGLWSAAPSHVAVGVTVLAGLAVVMALFCTSSRVRLKSPWSRRKRKHALSLQQWRHFFTPDGRLRDGGVKLVKKVRSGGVDPSIRAEVWPFLLGVYDLNSSKEERDIVRSQKRKEYEKLRRQCRRVIKCINGSSKLNGDSCPETDSPCSEDVVSARESLSSEDRIADSEYSDDPSTILLDGDDTSRRNTNADSKALNSDSSDSDSSVESEVIQACPSCEEKEKNDSDMTTKDDVSPLRTEVQSTLTSEDFSTWKRIIRLDAVRTNADWIPYSPTQAEVSEDRARRSAEAVGLKDYDHLEPCRVFHAARLVAILEAYALYDPEIGYCQGMSDLLSPIAAVMTEDHEAFWCFVGFMKKARHNFRLDELGIRRQLHIVSKIIRCKDSHLYRHLEKLQAEDCFFVYRMVVVLFRRELTFDQTICLWEVMWADQAAVRAGIGKSAWSRIRQRAPPTEDLLLYAIAASVLQKRKLIIEKYSSMDEIIRECNSMSGQLDIWKLLDDAHDLVVNLHDKIETSISAPSLS
ncbi:rab GTPase-activating protein 22 isoform X2 [Rosa chinensis]|uniref:rab GTPase-activating protein 22 isoform X2 n=1 Tax=Rosa chinensis TaxID=74649 RepID=UPI000D090A34|nr:rab GTPase-activating protein 22 isoform X2 [Rosa chinensis]